MQAPPSQLEWGDIIQIDWLFLVMDTLHMYRFQESKQPYDILEILGVCTASNKEQVKIGRLIR